VAVLAGASSAPSRPPVDSQEGGMDRGIDFLKSQINNAVMQHQSFVENLADHEKQAEDLRFRDLCGRFLPKAQAHQRMLEDYQREIGAETGAGKKVLGKALGVARDLADAARESDFLRLVGDIVASRQSEDTFKTFREAGKALGLSRLQEIGDMGEREHDDFHREANRLVQQMFVEHVREGDTTGLNISPSSSAGFDATRASTRTGPSSF
jgi:cell division septum initiation protein DivIVA